MLTQDALLTQHSLKPTRHRPGQKSSTLDLVFTSDPDIIQDLSQPSPIGCSDHICLHSSFVCREKPFEAISSNKYVYAKGDYISMNDFLVNVDWENSLSSPCIETNLLFFRNLLNDAINHYVPTMTINSQKLKPPWWNKSLASDIAIKRQFYLNYMQTSSHAEYV